MALILEKDKLIESIWEYRWWIMQNRFGFLATILRQKQYKETRGKHKEIAPRDIIKAKKQGLSEWFNTKRGYKGVYKWYITDIEDRFSGSGHISPDYFNYSFGTNDFRDYLTISQLSYDNLVKLNFALLTYLSRKQPMTKSQGGILRNFWKVKEDVQFAFGEPVSEIGILQIKNKLLKLAKEDNELDITMVTEGFIEIYTEREVDWVRDYSIKIRKKGKRAKTEESELFWNKEYEKFGDFFGAGQARVESAKAEAIEIFNSNKRPNIQKLRTEYLQSIGIDLTELSYL